MMEKLVFNFEENTELTVKDLMMTREFHQSMMKTLVEGLGDEVIGYIEKAHEMCVVLFLGGCLFGEENPKIPRMEIINRTQEFRSMARYLVMQLQEESLDIFDLYEEIYTQIMIHGIYFGQKNALSDN